MKPNEKRLILILILITIIMTIILIVRNNKKQDKNEGTNSSTELVQIGEDGTKNSTSSKLNETKKVGDIEISSIQIIEKNGVATLTANVKNTSLSTKKEFPMKIKLLNKEGQTIETLGAYVGETRANETRGINASINMDISEIYDVSVEM